MAEGALKNVSQDLADLKQQRPDVSVELRKQSTEDDILKRPNTDPTSMEVSEESPKEDLKSSLSAILTKAHSEDVQEQLQAIQTARKISSEKNGIDDLIELGIVPVLVQCLHNDNPLLQFEAAWALTNIASGNSQQTNAVVESGVVPRLIQLLDSRHINVCEQAVWALGNISGNEASSRDLVIANGVIPPLLKFVNNNTKLSMLRNVAWTLSNLCRYKPPPPYESVCQTLPALVFLVQHDDVQVKTDACWGLSFLADEQIQVVVESNVIPKLMPLLDSRDHQVVLPALRTLGNIVTGNDEQTQRVLDGGILPHLLKLVSHSRPGIVREAVWSMSNITAGNTQQIQMVIDANLVPTVIETLNNCEFKTQKEAAWVVSNFTMGGSPAQVTYLIQRGVIPAICRLLDCKDSATVQVVLDSLQNMLKLAGPNYENTATMIEECGGLEKLEELQQHENEDIYKLACAIIDNYFSRNDNEDDILNSNAGAQTF